MQVKQSFYTTVEHPFSIEHTEEVNCNFCGSKAFRSLGTELDFDIRRCAECHLVYLNPQPTAEEIPAFYDSMYLDDSPGEVAARGLGYTEKQLARMVRRRLPKGGKLLDIGCGFGAVLGEMANYSEWELHGTEIGEKAVDYAREAVPSATILAGTVDEVDFPPGHFECILMITVLEHVKDPRAVLERVMGWLKPGGLLVVQTPHVEPFIRLKRFLPKLPIYFEAPRHLFDFSPASLRMYMQQAGCRDTRVDIAVPYACGSRVGVAMIWGMKLVGFALHRLSFGKYIWPYSGGLIAHGIKADD